MKRAVYAVLLVCVGFASGYITKSAFVEKHKYTHTDYKFYVGDNNDGVSFWMDQVGSVRIKNSDGTSTDFIIPHEDQQFPGLILEQGIPLVIPDHHGSCEMHLLQLVDGRALIAFSSSIRHSVRSHGMPDNVACESISAGVFWQKLKQR